MQRKISVFNNVSLDGYFTDGAGDMSWAHTVDPEWQRFTNENAGGEAELIFGRKTYQMMASFWPTPEARQLMPHHVRDQAAGLVAGESMAADLGAGAVEGGGGAAEAGQRHAQQQYRCRQAEQDQRPLPPAAVAARERLQHGTGVARPLLVPQHAIARLKVLIPDDIDEWLGEKRGIGIILLASCLELLGNF